MPDTTEKRYTLNLTGKQISLLTQALGALELKAVEAAKAGADVQWIFDSIGDTFMTVYDVQEEWYRDNGVTD